MILFLLATQALVPVTEGARFEACAALAESEPARALDEAGSWRLAGGGVPARQCEALAYAAQKRWAPAAAAFEAAAREAESHADDRATTLWVQAGNAALAGDDPARATGAFDGALARGLLVGEALGEVHLDRARARAALGDLPGARSDLDLAVHEVPADPLGWLLSATLARRMGDLARARTDIEDAAKRSPDDPSVAFEAGNIAIMAGHEDAARTAWQAAIANAPASPAGRAAAESLGRLGKAR